MLESSKVTSSYQGKISDALGISIANGSDQKSEIKRNAYYAANAESPDPKRVNGSPAPS